MMNRYRKINSENISNGREESEEEHSDKEGWLQVIVWTMSQKITLDSRLNLRPEITISIFKHQADGTTNQVTHFKLKLEFKN